MRDIMSIDVVIINYIVCFKRLQVLHWHYSGVSQVNVN